MTFRLLALLLCLLVVVGLITGGVAAGRDRAALWSTLPWVGRYSGENAIE